MKGLEPRYGSLLYKIAIAVGLGLAFYLFYYFVFPAVRDIVSFSLPIITPFLLGGLLAALIEPIVTYLEKRVHINRGLAAFFTLILILGVFFTVAALGISRLTVEIVRLSKDLPKYSVDITTFFKKSVFEFQSLFDTVRLPPQLLEGITGSLSDIIARLTNLTSAVADFLLLLATALPNLLLIVVIALMAAFFFSRDKEIIGNISARILPSSFHETLRAVSEDVGKALFGYIRAQLTLMTITAVQTVIGLYLLGVDYAITMGFVVGLVDILPVLGPGAVFVPWIIYELFRGTYFMALALGGIYVFIIVVRQVLEPKIVAENIGLHPLATLISIYVGLKLFGFLGVILGPFFLVVIKAASRANIFSRWM